MKCEILTWVLKQKKNTSGKIYEIQINSILQLIILYQINFLVLIIALWVYEML